jgi:beta-glucanase (GH16 family)
MGEKGSTVRLSGRARARRAIAALATVLAVTAVSNVGEGVSAATANCGAAVPKPTGGTWTCTFAEEFSGTSLNASKWVALTTAASGFTNGGECFVNNPNNISVSGGVLNLTVRKEITPFTCSAPWGSYTTQYTGGYATTWSKFAQAYGRFEIRAKFPASKIAGLQSALWLWPSNSTKYGAWPASGEIDIAEFYTYYPDRVIPYVHYNDGGIDPSVTNNWCLMNRPEDFHTYLLEWTTTTLTIKYDGQTCVADTWNPVGMTKPAPFDQPFFINLTQALGITQNAVTPSTPLPATTQVDYVHVWS